MTDIDAMRLCAEAMGLLEDKVNGGWPIGHTPWRPLTNDAQAMMLVKRFNIHCIRKDGKWWANVEGGIFRDGRLEEDLNKAVVHCVAAMQRAATSNSGA